jgi:hypothetical protein
VPICLSLLDSVYQCKLILRRRLLVFGLPVLEGLSVNMRARVLVADFLARDFETFL